MSKKRLFINSYKILINISLYLLLIILIDASYQLAHKDQNYNPIAYMAIPKMIGLSKSSWLLSNITTNDHQVNWRSLAVHVGCVLAYHTKLYGVYYRGYPNGIK